jgi:hypothetical protein
MKSLITLNIKTIYNPRLLLKCRVHMVFEGPFTTKKSVLICQVISLDFE